jgi:antitoxin component YwqK of YwqJK toxin-antitoxin module
MKKYFILIFLCAFCVSCSTIQIRSVVKNAYRENITLNQKRAFVYYTNNNQVLSLDEEEYLRLVKIALNRQGMTVVEDSANADVIVAFCLSITDPRIITSQEPVYNITGGTGFYSGSVNSGHSRATYQGTYTQPYSLQYAGSRSVTKVMYGRYLTINAFDKNTYFGNSGKKLGEIPRVWECTVASAGDFGTLPQIAPYLIWSMEKYFGKEVQGVVVEKSFSESFKNKEYPKKLNNKNVFTEVANKDLSRGNLKAADEDKKTDGIFNTYYASGKLKEERNYENGKLNGICKTYHENGNIFLLANFKDDNPDGIAKYFYDNGKLMIEQNYKAGKLDGKTKAYYPNGKLMTEQNYRKGKQEGITKNCKENNDGLPSMWTYIDKNGNPISDCTCYDEQGSKTQCPKE